MTYRLLVDLDVLSFASKLSKAKQQRLYDHFWRSEIIRETIPILWSKRRTEGRFRFPFSSRYGLVTGLMKQIGTSRFSVSKKMNNCVVAS
jgi:S-adenosylmethionine:diacylglycerol 3-amino-3-carboxypropyl transferase